MFLVEPLFKPVLPCSHNLSTWQTQRIKDNLIPLILALYIFNNILKRFGNLYSYANQKTSPVGFLLTPSLLVEFEELMHQPVCFSIFTSHRYKVIFYPPWKFVGWVREASLQGIRCISCVNQQDCSIVIDVPNCSS